jgi:hypothetical protein
MRDDRSIDLAGLLAELAQLPRFDGARCRGNSELFDVAGHGRRDREQVAAAIALCLECPALRDCAEWLDSLSPYERPSGIVAGRLVRPAAHGGGGVPEGASTGGGITGRGITGMRVRVVRSRRAAPRRDRAAEWLRAALTDAGGSAVSDVILQAALAVGFDRKLLFKARRQLGVTSDRGVAGIGDGNRTLWTLP